MSAVKQVCFIVYVSTPGHNKSREQMVVVGVHVKIDTEIKRKFVLLLYWLKLL